jgi:ribonuclease T1
VRPRGRLAGRVLVAGIGVVTLLGLALMTVIFYLVSSAASPTSTAAPGRTPALTRSAPAPVSRTSPSTGVARVPAKATAVLKVVDATGRPPSGFVGGRHFLNDGRGGTGLLPERDAQGRSVSYTEYDVNPRRSGVNRGPERLVTGDDGSAYYTPDHYVTWVKIR